MKISGFENVIGIDSFRHEIAINEHERCQFSCWINEKDLDSFMGLLNSVCGIENDSFKFRGKVASLAATKDISGVRLAVIVLGDTAAWDEEPRKRIFQDEKKKLTDILAVMGLSAIKHEAGTEQPIPEILVQDNETDWGFIKKLANRYGEQIFPGTNKFIGRHSGKTASIEADEIIAARFQIDKNGAALVGRLKKSLPFGCETSYQGKKMTVWRIEYVLTGGEYQTIYHLSCLPKPESIAAADGFYLFDGAVAENDDPDKRGRIKVRFKEDCMPDNNPWLLCDNIFASKEFGLVCIPNIGDTVSARIYRGQGTVLACQRAQAYNSAYEDCQTKYLLLNQDVFISYKDNVFTIHNHDNIIKLTQDEINVALGEKCSLLLNKDKILLLRGKTALELSDALKAAAKDMALEAADDFSASASNVNIKGKRGVSIN